MMVSLTVPGATLHQVERVTDFVVDHIPQPVARGANFAGDLTSVPTDDQMRRGKVKGKQSNGRARAGWKIVIEYAEGKNTFLKGGSPQPSLESL